LAVLNKEPTADPTLVPQAVSENSYHSLTAVMDETDSAKVVETVVHGDDESTVTREDDSIREEIVDTIHSENESKERSISFLNIAQLFSSC
jgi:hypothetical protein